MSSFQCTDGWVNRRAARLEETIGAEQRTVWSTLDPVQWANESYRLALSNAYPIPKDGRIGQDYLDKNIPVVNERLSMAGVRLAALLNDVFHDEFAGDTTSVSAQHWPQN